MNPEPHSLPKYLWLSMRPFLGKAEIALAIVAPIWVLSLWLFPHPLVLVPATITLLWLAIWVAIRIGPHVFKKATWRLRNRLIVAYLFIAVVPILLILRAASYSAEILSQQVSIYLVSTEFERHVGQVRSAGDSLIRLEQAGRHDVAVRFEASLEDRFPGAELLLTKGNTALLPAEPELAHPPRGWMNASGLLVKDGHLYLWTHQLVEDYEVSLLTPITGNFLAGLVPHIGKVAIVPEPGSKQAMRLHDAEDAAVHMSNEIPPAMSRFDTEISHAKILKAALWESPGEYAKPYLALFSRISAVPRVIFSDKADYDQSELLSPLYGIFVLFLVIQLISLIIGISLSRSITGAVHGLYEGTVRVKEGDFRSKIPIGGNDQLASLSSSFNEMTTKVEQLLVVAKQQERIVAELEIARAVQAQLYPTKTPACQGFHIDAKYIPALSVSGDYYDYQSLGEGRIAVAIGDVAGKGISAALLMAALASTVRTQLRFCEEAAGQRISTAQLVGQLNKHLYANTTPEKYATFFLSIYDETTSELHYTNAGHLQPLLIREGKVEKLEVNGMVVGLFPQAPYTESTLQMMPGDMIVFYTDGVTEPEDAYDEMYGEDRLADLVLRNSQLTSAEILEKIATAVEQWTHAPESRDDLTLLIVRKS